MRRLLLVLALAGCTEAPAPSAPPPAAARAIAAPPLPPVEATIEELETLDDAVASHHTEVETCAAAQHAAVPDLAGRIELRWVVSPSGAVSDGALVSSSLTSDAAADGGAPARALETCVLGLVESWVYPAIDEDHAVTVHHTFTIAASGPAPSAADAIVATVVRAGTVRFATPTATGMSPDVVRRVVRRHVNEIRYCYEHGLAVAPDLEGRLTVHFTVDAAGHTAPSLGESHLSTRAEPEGGPLARELESCVVGAVGRWTFPIPEGGSATVDYPIVLSPGDLETVVPSGPTGLGHGTGTIGLGNFGTIGS